MQILARQNPFKFQGPPSSNRQNRFFQRLKSPCRRSKGISSVRALSVNFDQLYNPYRLQELGSSEKYSSTTYKSVQSRRQLTKCQLNELKIVQIGKGLLINEIPSAENTESIVSTYWKLEQILRENFLNKDQKLCPVCTGQGSLIGEQFKDSMFGNIEKITSGHPSFLSFPSNDQTHTVFYSILSNNEL